MSFRGIGPGETTGARIGRLLDTLLGPTPVSKSLEAPVLAMASGKGGTGKSFLTACLAVLLANRGCRVTVVDCDFGLATTHLLLGVQPRATLHHVVEGRASAADVLHRSPFGPSIVPGAAGVQEMAGLGRHALECLGAALGDWARDADVVLLDTGAGLSLPCLVTLSAADHVILVTQPELASLTDAYAVMKCLSGAPGPRPGFSAIVNRVRDGGQGVASFRKLAEVARRFLGLPLHYLGEVVDEPAVGLRRVGQPPLVIRHPSCRAALQIRSILVRATAWTGPFRPRPPADGRGVTQRFATVLAATR